jgi:demethylmenaquinone methyltransferase/2-methoxy-6-polyprenyl-1,4-benzoquinol methylase
MTQALRSDAQVAAAAAGGGAEKQEYVRRIFSEIAPRYDLLNHLLSFNIDRAWRRSAIRELAVERDLTGAWLDLCAGTLDVAIEIARVGGFHGTVVAADFAEPMLREGRKKLNGKPVHAVTGDALGLPLGNASMSGAIVAFGVRNLASLETGVAEVFRVLASGAHFVILEFTTPRNALVRALYLTYFNRVLPFLGGMISGHRSAYRYLPASVAHFPREEALAAVLRDAGFRSVRWRSLSFGVAAIHVGVKP